LRRFAQSSTDQDYSFLSHTSMLFCGTRFELCVKLFGEVFDD
jgi:hypothetical protein